jgi:hypothetical protein
VIVEILVGFGLVMAGAAAARVLIRRREAAADDVDGKDEPPKEKKVEKEKEKEKETAKKAKKKKKSEEPAVIGPRGLRVGDVLLYADTELWLAGMIELDEEGLVLRLFPTPGGTRADWLVQLDEEGRDVATLSETDEVPAGPIPESLPIAGRRVSLERRGDAVVHTEGEHLPRTSAKARYAILSDAGGKMLLVLDFEKAPRIALAGERVERHMLDLLPGGDLEEN